MLRTRPQLHLPTRHTVGDQSRTPVPKILVVDDEPQIVDLLSDLLEDEGYAVCNAFNGREALHVLQQETPHLVISDVMMPYLDGHELKRYLETMAPGATPKMILMSAVESRPMDAGVPFLRKPFDIDDLLTLIERALEDTSRRPN